MARMHNPIDAGATPGEKLLYRVFSEALQPDEDWLVFFNCEVGSSESDFIVCNPNHGLLVVEVKDWVTDQIKQADAQYDWVLLFGALERKYTNPYKQAKGYGYKIKHVLERDGRFMSYRGGRGGKFSLPIGHAVAFTNLARTEAESCPVLSQGVKYDRTLFKEDLLHGFTDPAKRNDFASRIIDVFRNTVPFELSERMSDGQVEAVIDLISPAGKTVDSDEARRKERVRKVELDERQRRIAEKVAFGDVVVRGVVGSGKTLVAVHRALFLKRHWPDMRILITCFNLALVQHIKHMLAALSDGPDASEGIEVRHFHGLVYDHIGQYDVEDEADYLKRFREKVSAEEVGPYGALIIDEGQDFEKSWVRCLTDTVEPKNGLVLFCHDPMQGIYGRKGFRWKSAGLHVRKKDTVDLVLAYRSTEDIIRCAVNFSGLTDEVLPPEEEDEPSTCPLLPTPAGSHYKLPVLMKLTGYAELLRFVARSIHKMVEKEGRYSLGDIGVVCIDYLETMKDGSCRYLTDLVATHLRGIFGEDAVELVTSRSEKQSYNPLSDAIKVIRIDACKGLEWKVVFALGFDCMPREGRDMEAEQKLTFMGLTRAQSEVVIPYVQDSEWIERIKDVCDCNKKDLWGDAVDF